VNYRSAKPVSLSLNMVYKRNFGVFSQVSLPCSHIPRKPLIVKLLNNKDKTNNKNTLVLGIVSSPSLIHREMTRFHQRSPDTGKIWSDTGHPGVGDPLPASAGLLNISFTRKTHKVDIDAWNRDVRGDFLLVPSTHRVSGVPEGDPF